MLYRSSQVPAKLRVLPLFRNATGPSPSLVACKICAWQIYHLFDSEKCSSLHSPSSLVVFAQIWRGFPSSPSST